MFKRFKSILSRGKILVLSGWWFRWFYTIWILKWLEELGLDKDIKAIFWVSIWAIIWALWSSGKSADEIYELLNSIKLWDFYHRDVFKKTWWLLSNVKIKKLIEHHLPKSYAHLKIKLYVWAVDTNTATYHLFDSWDLQQTVLWSMSIPWVFSPVKYKHYCLVDWWILNNFPVDLAKEYYPFNKILWVALNWFTKDQIIKSVKDNLMVNFQVILRSKLMEDTQKVDILFYRKIPIWVLSLDKWKMKKAYDMWYEDCIKQLWKQHY